MPAASSHPSENRASLRAVIRRGGDRRLFDPSTPESENAPVPVFEIPDLSGAAAVPLSTATDLAASMAGIGATSVAQLLSGATRLMSQMAVVPASSSIYDATLNESGQITPEISTNELRRMLREPNVFVFDNRTPFEYSLGHVPSAMNVAPKPGVAPSVYVSDATEIARIVPNNAAPIVLYCNGPFCGKSRRLGAELVQAGFTSVCRYQLGAPIWRALVGTMAIASSGVAHIIANDATAALIDARSAGEFLSGSIATARNVPIGEVVAAKDDGRLPMSDFNTRVVVYGRDGANALSMADALVGQGFNNVKFFDGLFSDLLRQLAPGSPFTVTASKSGFIID